MCCTMSQDDFDNRVKTILAEEFMGILDMGILSEESLLPVVAGMRSSLREAFPTMSVDEAEFHLHLLRDQCRETANSIAAVADPVHWN